MANYFPYRLVKLKQLDVLRHDLNNLHSQIESAKNFIREIENGNLSIEFVGVSEAEDDHALGASLTSMRDRMKEIADEEKRRNWTTEGLARFVDILRSNNDDLKDLGQVIISSVVKYMNANQGSLYILNDEDAGDTHLEMIACYAYDRKKYFDKKIGLGEGLVGQCVLEKAKIYMTNLPDNYIKITSGLGEALPKNLLIVPLEVNEKVYGVIELASFNKFEEHQQDFISKLAESIASTISNVRVNEQTKKLLYETQTQAEQVRAQEEEMRQNMEELSATQEEMQRILREVEGKEAYLNQLLNASIDSIFTIDRKYRLVSWNKAFAQTLEQFGMQLVKGMNTLDWYPAEERKSQVELYNRVLNGESFDFTASSDQNGSTYYHLSIYAPLKDDRGEIFEAAIFAKDITRMMNAQKQAEKLRQEAQEQTEEMKAQEEELRQNMEELSATQEEMHRILKEVESKQAYITELLNVSTDAIFTVDRDYKLVTWNRGFAATLEKFGMKLEAGLNTMDWYQGEDKEKQIGIYKRVFSGEAFEFTASSEQNGSTVHHLSVYAPLKDANGNVYEAAIFAKDVTAMIHAQKDSEKLASDAQHQAEELKAQEEELRQNMEELSATQDEMQRIMTELESKSAYANELLDAADDMIYTVDRDYKLVSWNKAFAHSIEKYGNKIEKGLNTLDWYPDAKQRKEQIAIYDRVLGGESFESTLSIDINGKLCHFRNSFKPLKNGEGRVYEAAMFTREVSEPVKVADHGEQFVIDLIKLSKHNIYSVDRDFNLLYFNDAFEKWMKQLGHGLGLGMNLFSLVADRRDQQSLKKQFQRVFKGEKFEQVQEFHNGSESSVFSWMHYMPIRNAAGEVIAAGVYTEDVTELMTLKKANSLLLKQIESRN